MELFGFNIINIKQIKNCMEKKNYLKYAAMACILGTMATACSDDDTPANGDSSNETKPQETQFIITAADATQGTMQGGVTLKLMSDLTKSVSSLDAYNDAASAHSGDYFTQVAYNSTSQTFTGFIYGRGATVLGSAGMRSYKIDNGKLVEIGQPVTVSNGGYIGTFGPYTVVTEISNPTFYKLTRTGDNITSDTITWDDQTIDGTLPGVTGVKDLGDNQVATALKFPNRDSVAVAFSDYNLKVSKVIYDDRIGATGGATRSVRYSMIDNDDAGNTYVFCGTSDDENKVGALRINKGTQEFDKNYKFDIYSVSGGYRFRSAIHITGDYFLLQCYNTKGNVANLDAATTLAIVNVKDQTFKLVSGISGDLSAIDTGWPSTYGGKVYLPVNASDGFSGGGNGGGSNGGGNGSGNPNWGGGKATKADATGVIPTVYVIDPATATATPLITMLSTQPVKAFTVVK